MAASGLLWVGCRDAPAEDDYSALRDADVLQFLPDDAVMSTDPDDAGVTCRPLQVAIGRQIAICERHYGTHMSIDEIRSIYRDYADAQGYRLDFDRRQGQRTLRWLMSFSDDTSAWDVRVSDPVEPTADENLSKVSWLVHIRVQLLEQDHEEKN